MADSVELGQVCLLLHEGSSGFIIVIGVVRYGRKIQTSQEDSIHLDVNEFCELGEFARAGMEAVKLALERANESLADGRIPISGAAVELTKSGKLKTVTIGSMVAYLRESCPFPL